MKKDIKEEPKSLTDVGKIEESSPKAQDPVEKGKKMRQILIETDGDNIRLVHAEVGGKIELIGIFQNLIEYLKSKGVST